MNWILIIAQFLLSVIAYRKGFSDGKAQKDDESGFNVDLGDYTMTKENIEKTKGLIQELIIKLKDLQHDSLNKEDK